MRPSRHAHTRRFSPTCVGLSSALFALAALLVVAPAGCSLSSADSHRQPPVVRPSYPGLPNFAQVSDELYRGAQPTREGFEQLRRMGIKTIVNLCQLGSDEPDIKGLGFYYLGIPSAPWNPKDDHMLAFLRVMKAKEYSPVFVHCQHGADRTGAAVAVYRVVSQGWTKEEAISEMDEFGFHSIWSVLKEYVRHLDVAAMKAAVNDRQLPKLRQIQ